MKSKSILFLLITAFFVCFLSVPENTYAAGSSVKLSCMDGSVIISDMEWNIYRIGEKSDNGFVLTEDFARYSVDLQDMSAENIRETANVLDAYATVYKHIPIDSGVTDKNGDVVFSNLEKGLYLASGKKVKYGNYGYRPSPVLIEVKESVTEQTVFPKFYQTSVFAEINTSYELRKIWVDNDNAYRNRPENVTIDLYKDGEFAETVILSEENNWQYRWVSGDPLAVWMVVERKIPKRYVVSVDFNLKQYLVKNTYNPSIAIDWDEDFDIIPQVTTTVPIDISENNTTTTVSDVGIDTDDANMSTSTGTDDVNNSSDTTVSDGSDLSTDTNTETSTDVGVHTVTTADTNTGIDNNTNTNTNTDTDNNTSSTTVSTVTTVVAGGDSGGNSGGGLPQTGQLWWPVIPLSLGGVLLVFTGIKIKPKKENNA